MKSYAAYRVKSELNALAPFTESVTELFGNWHLPAQARTDLFLCFDELLSNVIKYGTPLGVKPEMFVQLAFDGTAVKIDIIDEGPEFDPFSKPDPDLAAYRDELRVGGVGVYIVKQVMDDVSYYRYENRNIVSLLKKIS